MIASIAIANKQVLISRNSQLENVHGLQVESW
jgi:predicted nucleic acid-binding protein